MISICIQPSLLRSERNAAAVMGNSRRLPRQPACCNESFCTGEQRRQSLCGDTHVLGSIWDLKEVRSGKFRESRKEPLGSLLGALSWEARQACQREEASAETAGRGGCRNCVNKHKPKCCTQDKVTKEHRADLCACCKGPGGLGRKQAELESAESHCSTKGKSAPGLHLQGHHYKYRDMIILQYSVLIRLHPE